eukprot:TRINITY_DN3874_c0_g1_i1.p1 TRINITY_DN3874_c0_g1~~TRINITY_DN3874_c0_g1_i1.p1  ORF type:complete len:96 (-),score=9.80 TRINITY_DN3874_c0_g1_i1:12-299(-)
MARFFEKKIICQKLERITLADGRIVDGYKSRLCVSIYGMLAGIQNDGQLNGQVQEYEARYTANSQIFGVRDIFNKKMGSNTGMDPSEEYVTGVGT